MTPDELRSLADEATPGPWEIEADGDTFWLFFPGKEEGPDEADARLAALAPDLARLCAELADAAEQIIRCGDREELRSLAEAARYDLAVPLARLSELKPVT